MYIFVCGFAPRARSSSYKQISRRLPKYAMIRKDLHVIPSDFQGMKKKILFVWFPWLALIRNDSILYGIHILFQVIFRHLKDFVCDYIYCYLNFFYFEILWIKITKFSLATKIYISLWIWQLLTSQKNFQTFDISKGFAIRDISDSFFSMLFEVKFWNVWYLPVILTWESGI